MDSLTVAECSAADPEGLAYVYCATPSGYCVSLSRSRGSPLIEVMAVDQRLVQTDKVQAELHANRLVIRLPLDVADKLDGITEYTAGLAESRDTIDAALTAIFSGLPGYTHRT